MKPKFRHLRSLALVSTVMLSISSAQAATLYWDNNGTTAGFGAAGGTWDGLGTAGSGSQGWGTDITGLIAPTGTITTASTDAANDALNFGTATAGLGAGTITVSGTVEAGNITFGAASGAIVLSGGTAINLTAASTITVNNATNTIGTALTGAGTSLTKAGTGNLILTGANSYSGTTIINRGTLTLNRQTGSLASTPLTFSGTGTFNMDNVGASGALAQTLGALSFSAGQGTVQITRTAAFDQAITFASVARTAGASGNFVNVGGTNSATNGIILTSAPAAGTLIDRGIFYNGSAYATYDAGGFVRAYVVGDTNGLAAPAGTTIGASTATSNVFVTGAISAQTTISANTINLGANSITMGGSNQVLSANGILSSGSASATLGGGTTPRLQATALGNEIVARVNGASDVLTISSAIRNFGVDTGGTASALTKTGAGQLNLAAVNTLSGGININAGTLHYSSNINYGTVANNFTIGSGATLLTTGGSNQSVTFSGTVLNDGAIVRNTTGNTTFSNNITGTGSMTFTTGAGGLTLNGNNTFSGGFLVNGAGGATNQLNIGNNGALGAGTFTWGGGPAFNLNVANYVNSNNNAFALNSSLTIAGSYSTADFGTGAVTLGGNITVTNSNPVTFGGAIGETGGTRTFTKAGTGTLVLGGSTSNTYGGLTSVTAGALSLGKTGTANAIAAGGLSVGTGTTATYTGNSTNMIANAAPVTVVGTGLLNLNGVNDTIGSLTFTAVASNNARVTTGAGTLTLNGGVNFTAVTTGTAQITGNLDLGASTRTFNVGLGSGAGQDLLVSAPVTGSGGLTKTGTGRLTLAGGNSYTGLTTVTTGTLNMTAPSSLGNGGLSVASIFNYAPTTAGALNIGSGVLTLTTGSVIGTTLAGTASQSAITSTGAASLTGTGTINIYGIPGVAPTAGTNNLITALSGLNAGTYTLGTVFNNTDFSVSALTRTTGAISTDVTLLSALSGNVAWKGGLAGNTGVWSASNGTTTSNWQVTDGVNQPLAPGASADLVFSTTTAPGTMVGMSLGANMTVRTLTINNTATAFGLSDLNSSLTITPSSSATGITIGAGVLASSISAPVVLGANQTWTNDSINALTVSGAVSGTANLTKAGTGALTLSGANTYVGNTTLSAGTLNINNLTALGTAAGTFAINGGTINNTTAGALVIANTNPITVGGNFAYGGTQALTLPGTVNLGGATRTITVGGTTNGLTFSGIVSNGSLTKAGAGTLALSVAPTYTGATTIEGGTFDVSAIVGGASPISPLASTPSIAFTTASSTFKAAGSGTALTSYPTMSIANGITVTFDRGGGGNNTPFAIPSLTGGGTFRATNGGGASTNVTFTTLAGFTGNLELFNTVGNAINTPDLNDAASSKILMSSGSITQTPSFNYTGSSGLTLTNRQFELNGTLANAPYAINNNGTNNSALTINSNLAVTATGAKILNLGGTNTTGSSTFAGNIINGSGTISLNKNTSNTWTLSGANSYTGTTSISGGTLIARSGSALGTTSTANVTVATQTGLVYYAKTDTPLSIGGTLGIIGGTTTLIGASIGSNLTTARINVAGNATTTAAGVRVNIYGNTFSATVGGNGSYTLLQGGGTNTLNNATYTLGTVFNNTNFTVGAISKTANDVTLAVTTATPITAAFWKGGLTGNTGVWSASNGSTQSNWVTTAGGGNQALIPTAIPLNFSATTPGTMVGMTLGADMTVDSLIVSNTTTAFGLVNDGYKLTIAPASAANGILLNAGLAASPSIGTDIVLGANQTWTNSSGRTFTVSGSISGSGNLTKEGLDTTVLSGANTYTGVTTISAGDLNANTLANGGSNSSIGASTNAAANLVIAGGTLRHDAANVASTDRLFTIGGPTGDTASLTSSATSNTNVMSFTNSGAIAFGNTNAHTLTLGGTNGGNNIFAPIIGDNTGATSLVKSGTGGMWILTGSNTYSGATTINAGVLQANHNSALGTTAGATTVASGAELQLGNGVTITGETLNIAGGGLNLFGALRTAPSANAEWAGTVNLGASARLGAAAGTTLTVSGAVNGSEPLIISGASGTGMVLLTNASNGYTGATQIIRGILKIGATNALPTGTILDVDFSTAPEVSTFDLNGFDQTVAGLQRTGAGGAGGSMVTNSGGTIKTLEVNQATTSSFSGSITGNLALTKSGAGSLTLTANTNTYTGETAVNDGTLLVNNTTGSGTGTNTVSVASGATLGGTGTISGAVNVTGVLSPGASIETLGTGALSFATGSTLAHELDSNVATSIGSDLLKVTGNLNLVGSVGLTLADLAVTDVAFNVNDVFSLINYTGSLTGGGVFAFGGNDLAEAEVFTFGLNTWRINYTAAEGGLNYTGQFAGGSDSFVNLTVVPEPSSVALLGTLGAMLLLRRRR